MQDNIHNKQQNGDSSTPFVSFETAWASLKPALDKEAERRKKKRRFIFFWFFFFAIGLGLGSCWYLFKNKNPQVTAAANNKLSENINISKSNISKNKQQIIVESNESKMTGNNIWDKETAQDTATEKINSKANRTIYNNNIIKNKKSIATTENIITVNSNITIRNASAPKATKSNHVVSSVVSTTGNAILNNSITVNKSKINAVKKNNSKIVKSEIAKDTKQINNSKPTNGIEQSLAKSKIKPENKPEITDEISDNTIDVNNTVSKDSVDKSMAIKENIKTDTLIIKKDSAVKQIAGKSTKIRKESVLKSIRYGIQFNIPFGEGINYKDINSQHQPLSILIPTVWVSKQLSKKHSISLQINPYSQFYTSNNAVIESNSYNVKINQGSRINSSPQQINYAEKTSFNKIYTIEATLLYQYHLVNALKFGIGISNNWVQGALIENKVIRNYSTVTKDSLYGCDKANKEWNSIKSSFMLGRMELLYQINKITIGLDVSTPVTSLFTDKINTGTMINKNIFIKWQIR